MPAPAPTRWMSSADSREGADDGPCYGRGGIRQPRTARPGPVRLGCRGLRRRVRYLSRARGDEPGRHGAFGGALLAHAEEGLPGPAARALAVDARPRWRRDRGDDLAPRAHADHRRVPRLADQRNRRDRQGGGGQVMSTGGMSMGSLLPEIVLLIGALGILLFALFASAKSSIPRAPI